MPASGEIDIIRAQGQDSGRVTGALHLSEGSMEGSGQTAVLSSADLARDLSTQFHIYSLEWTKERLMWFVDETLLHMKVMNRSSALSTPSVLTVDSDKPETADGWLEDYSVCSCGACLD